MFRTTWARIAIVLSLICGLLLPAAAYAATDPFQDACSGSGSTSSVCTGKNNGASDPLTGTNGTLKKVTNILAVIAGIMAVIFMILGGIKYITSAGDPAEISKAKNSIIYALVGIIVIVLARSLIGWVLSKV